ncbi:Holliday junction branch migration protein RuvA [Candidatus Mesenet endosymbiont of Agriotes lineatus]|uniref:Holliday junction branch migration protein RuvA n=1 Tax=Candidatus Mesenet endosymbiont of Agriotes lineatus TaxID=3077948 RepID=UPI0030CFC424
MIGSLTGIIDEINSDHIILNVNGVGYIVYLSVKSLNLCHLGNSIRLFIETYHSRDNIVQLYGFITKEEQSCLRLLVKVNGISYRIAITILSKLEPTEVLSAIASGDKVAFKLSGLGPKLIARIITELQNEVNKLNISYSPIVQEDATLALINLGYDRSRVYSIVQDIKKDSPSLKTEDIIRRALKDLFTIK